MNWNICQLNVVKTFLFWNPYLPEFSDPQNSEKSALTRKYPLGICPDLPELGLREKPGDDNWSKPTWPAEAVVFFILGFVFCGFYRLTRYHMEHKSSEWLMWWVFCGSIVKYNWLILKCISAGTIQSTWHDHENFQQVNFMYACKF